MFFGALFGGITLFLWGAVSHMALPWSKDWVQAFPGGAAATEQLKTLTPQNGVYLDTHGYVLATSARPDGKDKTEFMTKTLGQEFAQNLIVAMILSGLIIAFRATSLRRRALLGAAMGLAAAIDIHFSYYTWYGFSWKFTILATVDILVGWFLASIAIGWAIQKFGPKNQAMA
jgi:hypothetical protein